MFSYIKSFFSGLLGLDHQQPQGRPKRTIKVTAVIDDKVKQQKKKNNSTFWDTFLNYLKKMLFSENAKTPSTGVGHPKTSYTYNPQDEQWVIAQKLKELESLKAFDEKTRPKFPGLAQREFIKALEKQRREIDFKYEKKFKEIQEAPLDFIKFVNYKKKNK